MIPNPKVAVITVSWNSADHTLECIESLLLSSYDNYTVFVIDNGSESSDLVKLGTIESERVHIHSLDNNYGYVGGVNRGLKLAEQQNPDYYLILNNDIIIDAEAMLELVKAAQRHNNRCITTGVVYDYYITDMVQQIGSQYVNREKLTFRGLCSNVKDPGFGDSDIQMDVIDDVFWLLPSGVFQAVGYYSHDFWFNNEQSDYALRAVKAGFKLIFNPKAKIWHKGSISIGGKMSNPVREYFDTKSRLIFRYKHMKFRNFIVYYLSTFCEILSGAFKQSILILMMRNSRFHVQLARLLGFIDFNKWLMLRNPDDGTVPRVIKRWI